eukprot:jgi/Psemu1/14792/gm1.14792_g
MVNGNPLKSNAVWDPLQTLWFGPDNIPVPRNGGNGFSEDMRKHTLVQYGEIRTLINNIELLPAARTARSRFRYSSNKQRDDIIGLPMFLLGVYQKIYYAKTTTSYECLAFLWRSDSYLRVSRLYSLKNVSEAENAVRINRKKGLTTANQAFTFGIYIHRDDMINVDEAGIKLEHSSKKMGKCSLCGRGQQWVQFDTSGTDAFSFAAFIESILEDFPPGVDGNRKCFIMDNLLAHHNPLTLDAIVNTGHRFDFRAPYFPVDGPIKYVLNTIEMALSYQINNTIDQAKPLQTNHAKPLQIDHGKPLLLSPLRLLLQQNQSRLFLQQNRFDHGDPPYVEIEDSSPNQSSKSTVKKTNPWLN